MSLGIALRHEPHLQSAQTRPDSKGITQFYLPPTRTVAVFTPYAFIRWCHPNRGSRHQITAYYSFIDPILLPAIEAVVMRSIPVCLSVCLCLYC